MRLETEAELDLQRARIEHRAAHDVPCETHGDLRLEHVYLLDGSRIAIIDCIEFSPRFSCADPIADIAFLAMDLRAHGAWPEARVLLAAYFDECGDDHGRALVPLYVAYRSSVRAEVRALQASAAAIPADQRQQALQLARAHVQLAVGELALAGERPCLVFVGGLPGTGKSVLSSGLAAAADFMWLRADAIRKELAGLDPLASGRADVRSGIYTPEWNERTYAECLARAKTALYADGEISDLQPAFEITVHRSQGGEFPAVVVPLVTQHWMMLQRQLIYTAVTRAKKLAVLVGSPRALRLAVENAEQSRRESGLAERLRAGMNRAAGSAG